jgi:hypothetical protein
MNDFIKLTTTPAEGEYIFFIKYLEIRHVSVSIGQFRGYTQLYLNKNEIFFCKESPEEVIYLINNYKKNMEYEENLAGVI